MDAKDYSALWKQFTLEQELEEKEDIIDSFRRVESGEGFSLDDLEVVRKTLAERKEGAGRTINMRNMIHNLEVDVGSTREYATTSKRRLRKRGIDLDRMRKQMRLQHERKRKFEMEKGR